MSVYSEDPVERTLRLIAWNARMIRDPARRLRYLRGAMIPESGPRRRASRWRRLGPACGFLAGLLLPLPCGSDRLGIPRATVKLAAAPREATPAIWLVEMSAEFELYSNGLRVENLFAVENRRCSWRPFARIPGEAPGAERRDPAGIVFHSSESHLPPFEPRASEGLQRAGHNLLAYVRANRLYHFVIDRFGRVHRIVRETDAANHAGRSVWADREWVYVNLNDSFLAVAFEARSGTGERADLTPAQLRSGRALVEMLRSRYGIAASNCVSHAQVSVNPGNHRMAYHTDWGSGLPFHELGLPDNYRLPPPSLLLFGFESEPPSGDAGDGGFRSGIRLAELHLHREAASLGLPLEAYRAALRRRFREIVAAAEKNLAARERNP